MTLVSTGVRVEGGDYVLVGEKVKIALDIQAVKA